MFETNLPLRLSAFAADEGSGLWDTEYRACWDGLPRALVPCPAGQ
jgi:homogentisate 1,2-dioxygenase